MAHSRLQRGALGAYSRARRNVRIRSSSASSSRRKSRSRRGALADVAEVGGERALGIRDVSPADDAIAPQQAAAHSSRARAWPPACRLRSDTPSPRAARSGHDPRPPDRMARAGGRCRRPARRKGVSSAGQYQSRSPTRALASRCLARWMRLRQFVPPLRRGIAQAPDDEGERRSGDRCVLADHDVNERVEARAPAGGVDRLGDCAVERRRSECHASRLATRRSPR